MRLEKTKMSPSANYYSLSSQPGKTKTPFSCPFLTRKEDSAREVVFSMTPKKLPKMVLINVLPTKTVNAYPLLCSLVLVIQVEWLMTLLFYFLFQSTVCAIQ